MYDLVRAYCTVRQDDPIDFDWLSEETVFEASLSILALAWCGFAWYVVVWLLVG